MEKDLEKQNILIKNAFYIRDPTLYEYFKKSLPPKEAYYYFPKGEEVFIYNKKKPEKSLRRIHYGVKFTTLENKWLTKFHEIIDSHPENKLPDYWGDPLNITFIYATGCDLNKSYEVMIKYIQWYKGFFPLNFAPPDKTYELLNTGFVYAFGRDHQFRPIIICNPYILEKNMKNYSSEEFSNASIFMCQYLTNNMLIPGQIENWIMFIDLQGTSLLSLPDPLKKLIKALSDNFIAKLYKSYILHMSWILRVLFKIVSGLLDEVTAKKINILSSKKDKLLFTDISPDNLEQRFGGEAPDLPYGTKDALFPPRMPANTRFLKPDEDEKDILISEEEYIKRWKEGKIEKIALSPYLKEKLENQENQEKEEKKKKIAEENEKKEKEKEKEKELKLENDKKNEEIKRKKTENERKLRAINNKGIVEISSPKNWIVNENINEIQSLGKINNLCNFNYLKEVQYFGLKKINFTKNLVKVKSNKMSKNKI